MGGRTRYYQDTKLAKPERQITVYPLRTPNIVRLSGVEDLTPNDMMIKFTERSIEVGFKVPL